MSAAEIVGTLARLEAALARRRTAPRQQRLETRERADELGGAHAPPLTA